MPTDSKSVRAGTIQREVIGCKSVGTVYRIPKIIKELAKDVLRMDIEYVTYSSYGILFIWMNRREYKEQMVCGSASVMIAMYSDTCGLKIQRDNALCQRITNPLERASFRLASALTFHYLCIQYNQDISIRDEWKVTDS